MCYRCVEGRISLLESFTFKITIFLCIYHFDVYNFTQYSKYRYNRHEEHDINMIYNIDDDDDNNNDDDIMDHDDDQENSLATFREIIQLFENE